MAPQNQVLPRRPDWARAHLESASQAASAMRHAGRRYCHVARGGRWCHDICTTPHNRTRAQPPSTTAEAAMDQGAGTTREAPACSFLIRRSLLHSQRRSSAPSLSLSLSRPASLTTIPPSAPSCRRSAAGRSTPPAGTRTLRYGSRKMADSQGRRGVRLPLRAANRRALS